MSELKNCPFCNGQAEFERKGNNRHSTIVTCTECGCTVEDGSTFNFEDKWNERPREEMVQKRNKVLVEELEEARERLGVAYKEGYDEGMADGRGC